MPKGPEVGNSVKKKRTWTLRCSLSVMKCAWAGGVIRIRKAVTRFGEGGNQTRPVDTLERDFICNGCPQGLAACGMNSPRTVGNAMGNHVLVALQYCKANRLTCQAARSRRSLGNLKECGSRLAPAVRIPYHCSACTRPRKNTHIRRCKRY